VAALTTGSLALSSDASAKGPGGPGAMSHGNLGRNIALSGRHFGLYGVGYAGYNSCWKWTPRFGWINVCVIDY
jgi:hypothetical protein